MFPEEDLPKESLKLKVIVEEKELGVVEKGSKWGQGMVVVCVRERVWEEEKRDLVIKLKRGRKRANKKKSTYKSLSVFSSLPSWKVVNWANKTSGKTLLSSRTTKAACLVSFFTICPNCLKRELRWYGGDWKFMSIIKECWRNNLLKRPSLIHPIDTHPITTELRVEWCPPHPTPWQTRALV